MTTNSRLQISGDVAGALDQGAPVVALESTIITHGMPYPQNLDMAREVEAVVRDGGATPATIAIMDGWMMAGLDERQIETLAREGHQAAKASRRDLAALLALGRMAGTTVATTMQIAQLAGIAVFATGGIGGVHRGAEESFDISADLTELGRTPVAVVCAGAKSILDIGKTLEVLETNGVPVFGYRSDDFPAFYLPSSGYAVDHRFDDATHMARALRLHFDLGMGGVVIGNPIPAAFALDAQMIGGAIATALDDAKARGISGKDTTPFLLQRLYDVTEGESLRANIGLVKNNARVAAEIAVALAARQ